MKGSYLLALVVFLAFLLGVGVWAARRSRTGEDFLLAGRRLGPVLLLGTTLATLVGTGSSLGAVGFAYENGWAGSLYGIGGAVGVFILLALFADARRHRFMTFSEEMSFYYGAHRGIKGTVAIVLLVAEVGWLGAHVLGGSLYLHHLTGLDPALSKVIVAIGFGAYTVIGGYLAVVVTDAIQGILLFVGFTVLAIVALVKVGGFDGIAEGVPDEMSSFLGVESLGVLPAISLAVAIAIGVLATPSYRQRIYSARSVATVRGTFAVVGGLFLFFSIMPAIAGLAARTMTPEMENPDLAFPFLATSVFPFWLGAFLLVAGMSATMSSGDSDAVTAVTILLRDVVQLVTGRMPKREHMVRYSRIALAAVLTLALVFALLADTIIDYITMMISTLLTGLLVAALLGKFWRRATWWGGLACMVGGSGTALIVNNTEAWSAYWGNAVIPSLIVAALAGVIVSLLTPPTTVSREEALRRLAEERSEIDVSTELKAGTSTDPAQSDEADRP